MLDQIKWNKKHFVKVQPEYSVLITKRVIAFFDRKFFLITEAVI